MLRLREVRKFPQNKYINNLKIINNIQIDNTQTKNKQSNQK